MTVTCTWTCEGNSLLLWTKISGECVWNSHLLIVGDQIIKNSFNILNIFLNHFCQCMQTCQLSRFCRESHDFLSFLTVSRQGSSISRVLGKIILKWFKLLNQNKNGKLTRNACAIKWKTNKEEHCSYFFVPSCDFRLCSINLIVFLRVCPPFWKGSRPWERGLIPRRLPCWVSQ